MDVRSNAQSAIETILDQRSTASDHRQLARDIALMLERRGLLRSNQAGGSINGVIMAGGGNPRGWIEQDFTIVVRDSGFGGQTYGVGGPDAKPLQHGAPPIDQAR